MYLENAGLRTKRTQIWTSGVLGAYEILFTVLRFQSQCEVILYISNFQHLYISKTVVVEPNGQKIWASGVGTSYIQGTFHCYVFKVILRSFGAFPNIDKFVSQKHLAVEEMG